MYIFCTCADTHMHCMLFFHSIISGILVIQPVSAGADPGKRKGGVKVSSAKHEREKFGVTPTSGEVRL